MKFFKYLIFVVIGILALGLILAAFLPGHYVVARTHQSSADSQRIFFLLADLKNWAQWSEWQRMDSNATYAYSSNTSGVDAWMSWKGEEVGEGKLTITEFIPNQKMTYELAFVKPMESTSFGFIELSQKEGGTKITWQDEGDLPYPMGRLFFGLSGIKEDIGNDFSKNMANMAAIAELAGPVPAYPIEIKERPALRLFSQRHLISADTMDQAFRRMFSELANELQAQNAFVSDTGHWITALYHSYSADTSNIEAAIAFFEPYPKEFPGNHGTFRDLGSTPSLFALHRGSYASMGAAYEALDIYRTNHGLQTAGAPMEVYLTDPSMEPDTNQWITWIYWPIIPNQ